MPYIQKTNGVINGVFANAQPGYAEDWLDDDSAELLAFFNPLKTYRELRAAEYNLKSTGEQFAMIYKDAVNGTNEWVDWQTEIKVRIAK